MIKLLTLLFFSFGKLIPNRFFNASITSSADFCPKFFISNRSSWSSLIDPQQNEFELVLDNCMLELKVAILQLISD